MQKLVVSLCALALMSCGSGEAPAGNEAANAAATADAKPKRAAYCFFKDAETEKWSAARDAQGNVTVKGRAFRSDPRYKAELGAATIDGTTATISPTISQNGGYAAPGNWWDVTATIPDSRAVNTVKVNCGSKTLAEFRLDPAG